jgi:hypothetical protein
MVNKPLITIGEPELTETSFTELGYRFHRVEVTIEEPVFDSAVPDDIRQEIMRIVRYCRGEHLGKVDADAAIAKLRKAIEEAEEKMKDRNSAI